jgi:hypothetical protein
MIPRATKRALDIGGVPPNKSMTLAVVFGARSLLAGASQRDATFLAAKVVPLPTMVNGGFVSNSHLEESCRKPLR